MDIHSHYFENGNVRMDVHKELSPTSQPFTPDAAAEVFKAIGSFEDSLQEGLQEVFTSMKQDALRVGSVGANHS